MAYPILGIPRPSFADESGSPFASGTVTIQNPSDSAVKASYPTAADANASTNGTSADVTLNARGQPEQDLWGRDGEDYKIIIKNAAGATQDTWTAIQLPGHEARAAVTFGATDATPTVAESQTFITAGTGTARTDFDNGVVGDTIYIKGHRADGIQISDSSANDLKNIANLILGAKDTVTLHMFVDQVWTEVARSTNSDYMKPLTADAEFTDTTLADVSQMSGMILKPKTYYRILGYLKVISDGNTQDIKFALQTDNAFQEDHWSFANTNEDGTTTSAGGYADAGVTTTGMIADIVTAKVHGIAIQGMCLTHATLAPTVDFQAAQGTDAGTTTLEKGSWISFDEVSTK